MKIIRIRHNFSIIIEYISLLFATIIIFGPLIYLYLNQQGNANDYHFHIVWAKQIATVSEKVPREVFSHAGWQWLVWLSNAVFDISWINAAIVVTLGSIIFTAWVFFTFFRQKLNGLISGALSIGLNLVAPILLIDPVNNINNVVNGYINSNIFHNPTYLLLKPFAVLQFFLTLIALSENTSKKNIIVLITSLVSAAAAFSKPNYVICLLPAIGLIIIMRILRKKRVDWFHLLLGIVIPSLILLIWQFILTYSLENKGSIIFSPFAVFDHHKITYFIPKLILSLIFPLCVTLLFWRKTIYDQRLQLSWLVFFISIVFLYLFTEPGTRQFDANFYWSAEVTLFILNFANVWFLVDNNFLLINPIKKWIIITTGFAHLAFGITCFYFFVFQLISQNFPQYWW